MNKQMEATGWKRVLSSKIAGSGPLRLMQQRRSNIDSIAKSRAVIIEETETDLLASNSSMQRSLMRREER